MNYYYTMSNNPEERRSQTGRGGSLRSRELMNVAIWGKVKVKVTLVQALRLCTGRTAYRGSRGIAVLFHDHGTRRG
jgi:hypothetical protein